MRVIWQEEQSRGVFRVTYFKGFKHYKCINNKKKTTFGEEYYK